MQRKLGLLLTYAASLFLAIGGLGDQFINRLLGVHRAFLGNPDMSPLFERAEALIILMLHALGGGLMAAGVACLFMTHFALRHDLRWARMGIACTAVLSEGWNAYGMYSAGSYWFYPVFVLIMMFIGLLLYRPQENHPTTKAA